MAKETKKPAKNVQLPDWKDRSMLERVLYIVALVLAAVILVGFILDIINGFGWLPTSFYFGVLGASFIVDAVIYWKYQKRNATIFLVCGILIAVYAILSLFLM